MLVRPAVHARAADRLRRSGSVFAENEATALADTAESETELLALVARREAGEPIEYITGYAHFAGLRLHIEPGVFIPRHRSEWLAELACRSTPSAGALLDLGCGCGALAAYTASRHRGVAITAVDIDPRAVRCAALNLPGATVLRLDRLADLPPERSVFDVIVANLPYVPTDEIVHLPREARESEPARAIDGGTDGLTPLRAFAPELLTHLGARGTFLVEVAEQQVTTATELLLRAGFARVVAEAADDEETIALRARAPR